MLPETVTDADIRAWLAGDFEGYGRCRCLSAKLGISVATASAMKSGMRGASLVKPAEYYGYVAATRRASG